jgi:hypothetical protein
MAPPVLLFCDTDCLIQLFITSQLPLFRWYKSRYDLQAVIVPEVESELAWHTKFKGRFDPDLKKALGTGLITVFDYSRPDHLSAFFPALQAASAAAQAITNTGNQYALQLGSGEAYSHAVCIHLGMPLLSHDKSAINTLRINSLQTAAPVLRVFDLVTLAYQQAAITTKECDSIRQALDRSREFLPRSFRHASFERGLAGFDARLLEAPVGAPGPAPCRNFDDRYYLVPV